MKWLVSVEQLSYPDVFSIFDKAKSFKLEGLKPIYGGDWVLMFLEPSTRTRLSFDKALRGLGFKTYDFLLDSSSIQKGESFEDTLMTLKAQGFEGVVIRSPQNEFWKGIEESELFVINAGDGTNEHPTQALVDAFTLWELFDDIQGLKILYVGDVAFSRVFRSGYKLFRRLGCEVGICAPPGLKPPEGAFEVKEFEDLDKALRWCDVAIFLRIQRERQDRPLITSERDYFKRYGLTHERAEMLRREGKFYMHPGPVNRGIEMDGKEIYGANSLVLNQITNGVFVRAAVVDFLKKGGERKLNIER
jgi:aspartate carbamoyltransferase catalytic subunit